MPLSDFQMGTKRFGLLNCGGAASYFACGVRRLVVEKPGPRFRLPRAYVKLAPLQIYRRHLALSMRFALKAEHGDDAKFLAGGQSLSGDEFSPWRGRRQDRHQRDRRSRPAFVRKEGNGPDLEL